MDFVRSRGTAGVGTRELAQQFSVPKERYQEFVGWLRGLEADGSLVQLRGGRWAEPALVGMTVGRLQRHPRGFAFVVPVRGEGEDVHVARRLIGDAVHGDLVVVRHRQRIGDRRGQGEKRGPAGQVVKVLRRANERLIGTFVPGRREGRVKPDTPSILREVLIPVGQEAGAAKGDKVRVQVTKWPSGPRGHMRGRVEKVLGREGDPGVDEQIVILQFNLAEEFPAAALREAEAVPREPSKGDRRARRDLRRHLTIAIDPETARDRDDALSIYRDERSGNRVVLVHISDVSHYVRPGSALDEAARERGLSVYLVSDFIPMLPKAATQEALSLAEGKDSLVKTAMLEFDDEAELVGFSLCRAVVNTDRTMTYAEVAGILDAADAEDETRAAREMAKWSPELWDAVTELDRLAGQLRARRREAGSIDLDVPDYDVRVDEEGRVTAVSQIERDRSHDLVEEFMLCANRSVARLLQERGLPGIFRTHEEPEPDDLAAFATFVKTLLGRAVDPRDRRQLQDLLLEVSGTDLAEPVNMELLRCMKRARYEPEPGPHYALHFPIYCHFTSPIRRYPDLVVHQILDGHLEGRRRGGLPRERWKETLPALAEHCTEAERRADEAEREIVKIKLMRFLQRRRAGRGEVFDAIITGVQRYGAFAQIKDYSVEGLIRLSGLKDDAYRFEERNRALVGRRTGRVLRLGQSVRVVIEDIDLARRQVDLALAK